mmetsp:Transcript_30765/g.89850  ORF Transcript_30765/g.89850 Transcript_30765/m.89850 type:complete len:509 (-) Transcript_30765:3974-5500(-)
MMLQVSRSEAEAIEGLRKYGFCLMKSYGNRDFTRRDEDILAERRFALSERTKAAMTSLRSSVASSAPEEGFSSSTEHKGAYHYTALGRPNKQETLPWGFGQILSGWKDFGVDLFEGINQHILNHCSLYQLQSYRILAEGGHPNLYAADVQPHSFPTDEEYEKYLSAVKSSNHHVLSCFRYHDSNPSEFHVAAHVDKGVLTICENPNSLEIRYKGCWYSLGPQPGGVIAVLVGYSLERVTGGLFQAALHRVRNEGARSSRVTKIRFDPNLVVYPPAIIASADAELCAMLPGPPDCISVGDMMVAFNSTHTSINVAPAAISRGMRSPVSSTSEGHHSLGMFSGLPKDLLHNFFRNWICDFESVFRLSATCKSFRAVLGSEEYLIPLADRNVRLSWDWCLDGIGPRIVVPPGDNPNKWLALLSKELRKSHNSFTIEIRDMAGGERTRFKIGSSTPLAKVFNAFAARKGVAISTLRFLWDGNQIGYFESRTPYQLDLQDGDEFDCVPELVGD